MVKMIKPKDESRKGKLLGIFLFLFSGLVCLAGLGVLHPVQAASSDVIHFQGKLVNSNQTIVSDDIYTFRFALIATPTGGNFNDLWFEDHVATVTNGQFFVRLGSVTPFPADLFTSNPDLYLQICLNVTGAPGTNPSCGSGTHAYEEVFATRLVMGEVAYANTAKVAENLVSGGITFSPDDFLRSNANDEYEIGNTLTITGALDIETTALSIADTSIIFDGATTHFNTGNLSINSDDFFTDMETTTDHLVGFGTAAPTVNLDVAGRTTDLNSSRDGETATWATATETLPDVVYLHSSVTANGYAYVIGGINGTGTALDSVYYAVINSDGSTGTWQTNSNALPGARYEHSSVVANGYLYVLGGLDSGNIEQTTVYYAKLNSDGSTGTWRTNVNSLPDERAVHSSVVVNGYVYVMGGQDDTGEPHSTVYYAKLNSDGSTGSWTVNANALSGTRKDHGSIVANGYVYVIGGDDDNVAFNTVLYAKVNGDGSLGAWSASSNTLPSERTGHSVVAANGHVYALAGLDSDVSFAESDTLAYAQLNSDGSTGTWSTNIATLSSPRVNHTSMIINGYMYVLGGYDGTNVTDTASYASLARTKINGSLDLLGLSSFSLTDYSGNTGSAVYAGNIYSNNTLEVAGNAQFWSGFSANGDVSVKDNLAVGSFKIIEGGTSPTFYTTFTGGDQAANITYTLPTAQASAPGQVLVSDASGILSWVTPAGGVTADSLDYDDFEDTMDLDANLILNQTTFTWDQNYTGDTGTGYTYSTPNLTTGTAFDVNATNTALTNTAIQQVRFDLVNAQGTAANTDFTGIGINFTNNPTVAGNTEVALRIQNQVTANTTDNAVSALLLLDNADTSAAGSTVVTDAIRITNSGNIANGITTGLNIADSDIATDIALQNGETIDNDLAGIIRFSVDAAAELELSATNLYATTDLGQSLGTWTFDTTPDVTITGGTNSDLLGIRSVNAGDMNGDGYNDLLVTALLAGPGDSGMAYVFFGGATVDTTADVILAGEAATDQFGYSASTVGDVNGDGYADIVVGANLQNVGGTDRGRAYLYYGGSTVNNTADLTISGSVDDDELGTWVTGGGDLNGDGYGDFVVTAVGADGGGTDRGQCYVFFGGPNLDATPDLILTGLANGEGMAVAEMVGDVNGDGFDDLITGAPTADVGGTNRGSAYLFFGGANMDSTADATMTGATNEDEFGGLLGRGGDFNNDGYSDFFVAAYTSNTGGVDTGYARLYFGGSTFNTTPDGTFSGAGSDYFFGSSIHESNDLNSDGYDDAIIAAYQGDLGGGDSGVVYVYYGGTSVNTTPDITIQGLSAGDSMGTSVSAADFNGDGYIDISTGAYLASGGGTARGQAYIFLATGNRFLSAYTQSVNASNGINLGTTVLRDWGLITDNEFGITTTNWEVDSVGNASFQDLTVLRTRVITLSPEYEGGSVTAFYGAGTDTAITGTMTSDAESGTGLRSYYEWSSTTATPLQYFTVAVRVKLPQDFHAWPTTGTGVQINYVTSSASAANSVLDAYIYNASNTSTAVTSDTGNASTTWATVDFTNTNLTGGSQAWGTAGDTAIIFLRMGALNSNTVRLGDIKLSYISKW